MQNNLLTFLYNSVVIDNGSENVCVSMHVWVIHMNMSIWKLGIVSSVYLLAMFCFWASKSELIWYEEHFAEYECSEKERT